MPKAGWEWARRRGPELALAALAGAVFLGFLGSMDLWGKREQRAVAESIDTIARGHWLVAQIQGRPRLEKPPLPRWTTAALMLLTGRRDEWIVRLPAAASALGMVALAYALGRRLAGRQAGLAAGLALTSMGFFIAEMRQAGNDGPLAFFTALAIYCAWRRLHGGPAAEAEADPGADDDAPLGPRGWAVGMYAALGLGFLCKGPIVVVLVALTVVPALACAGRLHLRRGLRGLVSLPGAALFLALALSWPLPVWLSEPDAAGLWYLEMAQKAGSAGVQHHRHREVLALELPGMTAPWAVLAVTAMALPLTRRGRDLRPAIWWPWWWATGNLAMFCLWNVAKPNYYLPCLPGAAILVGLQWVRLTRSARAEGGALAARLLLQGHWVALFVAAAVGPAVVHRMAPQHTAGAAAIAAALALGVVASAWAWRRGADAMALAPIVAAGAVAVLVGYGRLAPADNPMRGHRGLATTLDELLPPGVRTVRFYNEIDEGLWFYLRDRALEPVPGSQPRLNFAWEMYDDLKKNRLVWDRQQRLAIEEKVLLDWLRAADRTDEYVLMRAKVYDLFQADLAGLAEPVYREHDLGRNELVLLKAPPAPRATASQPPPARR